MKFVEDKGNGYLYCYNPDHYCANKSGKVYEHVYVMSEAIGRILNSGECVHHMDRDKKNNLLSNLRLMTCREHSILHQIEDNGVIFYDTKCVVCKTFFNTTSKERKICSLACSGQHQRKFEISKVELELLVWTHPTVKVGKMLGVSDVAIGKRCKKLGIEKPPRGYWRKMETGKI